MGEPNPKGDDTQVVDALMGLASRSLADVIGSTISWPVVFSQASNIVAGSVLAASVAVVQFFCNVWLKKQSFHTINIFTW